MECCLSICLICIMDRETLYIPVFLIIYLFTSLFCCLFSISYYYIFRFLCWCELKGISNGDDQVYRVNGRSVLLRGRKCCCEEVNIGGKVYCTVDIEVNFEVVENLLHCQ